MTTVPRDVELYQCPSCSRIEPAREPVCCGEPMESIEITIAFKSPGVEELAQQVFGASALELEICDVLMAEGEASVSELTEHFSRNRSTVFRHLNRLVERGIVIKQSKKLKEGGQAHVYSCVPPNEIRRKLEIGLYMWAQEAMEKIDERMQAKIEMAEKRDGTMTNGPNIEPAATTRAESNNEAESKAVEQRDSLIERLFDRN